MAEYIDRGLLLEKLQERGLCLCVSESDIKELPAADVALVVHGYWKTRRVHGINYRICSVCGEYRPALNEFGKVSKRVYCPNCGVKMDKEGNDGD